MEHPMEPTTSAAGGYFISKLAAGLAALLGSLAISPFYQPKKLHQYGKLTAGAIIGSIAVSAAFALGGVLAHILGVDFQNIDIALGLGWIIGILSVGMVTWVANFLEKREGHDILEVATEVKQTVRGQAKTPAPAAKKTPATRKPRTPK
jgi:cation transporter-like permease